MRLKARMDIEIEQLTPNLEIAFRDAKERAFNYWYTNDLIIVLTSQTMICAEGEQNKYTFTFKVYKR